MANSKLSTGSAMLVRYCMFFALLLMGVSASFAQTTRTSVATGNWSTASTWSPSGIPAPGDNVVIAASHTVTLTANVSTTGNLTVNGTLNRGTRNMIAGSLSGASTGVITSTSGLLTVGSNSTSTTYAGKISGATTAQILNKRGTGTLTLTGNSDFTGGNVFVQTGTLRLGVAGALPTTAVINVYNGGTFDLNGFNQTVKYLADGSTSLNPASPVAIVTNSSATAATLTLGTVGADEYSSFGSTMTGKLNMVVNDGMYLSGSGFGTDVNVSVSNGANLELGLIGPPSVSTVLGGNLSVASGGKVGLAQNATCKTLTLGATLQAAGTYGSTASSATTKNNTFFEVTLTGVLTATSGSSPCLLKTSTKTGNWNDASVWTPAGVPASCDNVKILATHTVTLTGNTTIDGNNISAYNPGTAGDRLNVLGTLNTAGFNLTVNGGISAGTTSSPAGTINTGTGGVVTQNWNGTQQTAITITGSGGFTKLGSGATNFNRNQTYTGTTTIGAGATLGIGFNSTTGSISSSSIVNDGTLRLNRSNDFTLSANISGTGDVVKMRSSTVTLSGNNTYQGKTYIGASYSTVAGTLVIANSSSLPAATNLIFYSATSGKLQLNANATCASLLYGAVTQPNGSYGSTASAATNKNNIYFAGTGVLNVGSSPCLLKTSTKTGNWSDPTVWTPAGVPASCDNVKILATHTVTLTGNTTIDGNNISAYNPGTAGDRLNVLGTLNTAGFNLTVNGGISAGTTSSPAGTINTGTGGVVTQNWNGTQQTAITITGSGGFTKLGSGATNFNRNQTYTGTTTIGAGATLGIGFNSTTGSISSSSIVNDGTLRLNRSNDFTLSANISGTGDVVKMRSSTVTLSGNNTYQGKTYIGASYSTVAGTLVIANSSSLPAATNLIFYSATSGKLQLNANATCASLLYGAVTQPNGSYGSTASAASNKNDTYFSVSGTGVLNAGLSLVPSTFPGGTSIQGRARWGATGFEGGLYIGNTVGPTLNPTGTPVWVIGTAYAFAYGYNGTTGDQTLSIDFDGNNTFDASEVITQSTGFAGQGFQHFSIFMSGDATRSISLNNFVVNGVNLGNFVSPTSGSLDLDWVNPSGNFSNITATGTITFTGATGGGAETGRIWFRTAVPQPLMMAITERVMEFGSAKSMAAENAASAEVSLYPNPTVTGRVSFRLPMADLRSNGGALSSTVEAIDYTGSVKLSRKVTIDDAGRGELDASSLSRGAYILRVSVAGRVFTTRMVRQ
jgi:autotransporter-associated beta strand protein